MRFLYIFSFSYQRKKRMWDNVWMIFDGVFFPVFKLLVNVFYCIALKTSLSTGFGRCFLFYLWLEYAHQRFFMHLSTVFYFHEVNRNVLLPSQKEWDFLNGFLFDRHGYSNPSDMWWRCLGLGFWWMPMTCSPKSISMSDIRLWLIKSRTWAVV